MRLKRPYLVIVTVLITIVSGLFLQLCVNRVQEIKKELHECDTELQHTCSYYDYRQFIIHR